MLLVLICPDNIEKVGSLNIIVFLNCSDLIRLHSCCDFSFCTVRLGLHFFLQGPSEKHDDDDDDDDYHGKTRFLPTNLITVDCNPLHLISP